MQTDIKRREAVTNQNVSGPKPQNRGLSASTALLPARVFLGIVFLAAGIDKLADPEFFDPAQPGYIGKQLVGFATISPLGDFLTNFAVPNANLFGWMILLGEIAIGLGTLVGLFSRTAAFFGFVVSVILWLSTSWSTDPFYLGADLPYAVAWLVLAIGGAHPILSLDGQIKRWQAGRTLATISGSAADSGATEADVTAIFPQIAGSAEAAANLARRRFVVVAGATLATGGAAVIAWRNMLAGRNEKPLGVISQSTPATTTTAPANTTVPATATTTQPATAANTTASAAANPVTTAPTTNTTAAATTTKPATTAAAPATTAATQNNVKGVVITRLADVPAGSAKTFQTPNGSQPAILIHADDNTVQAFSAVCTHEGCIVSYSQTQNALVCPCHGAIFDAKTGAAIRRPARQPLAKINVQVDGSGNVVYVQG